MTSERQLVFAGAGPVGAGTPWGTIAEIMARLLARRGYEVQIETRSSMMNNARYVADGRADLGATYLTQLRGAYEGAYDWAPEGPKPNLRVLANVNHPSWVAVAVRAGCGITDLSEIREQKLALRVRASNVLLCRRVCEYYGLDAASLAAWGGSLKAPGDYPREGADFMVASATGYQRVPWVEEGDFDVIIDTVYAAYTPEVRHFPEAAILHDLRFLPLPDELVGSIEAEGIGSSSPLPHKLLRGVNEDVPSVIRLPHAIYCREETPASLASEVVEAIDRDRAAFATVHIPFSVDPDRMALDFGVPFHPAAAGYYAGRGYPT